MPYSKINRPFVPVPAGVVFQAERNAVVVRLTTQPLYEDRDARAPALSGKRASPFEVKWPRACAGLTAVDHPLQQPGETTETYRCQLGLDADSMHDGRDGGQLWNVAL